jgi:hypothetical protein
MFQYFITVLMWFRSATVMTELISGMSAPQLGTNLRECEDQSWLTVRVPQVEKHCSNAYKAV